MRNFQLSLSWADVVSYHSDAVMMSTSVASASPRCFARVSVIFRSFIVFTTGGSKVRTIFDFLAGPLYCKIAAKFDIPW
ncbi:MAG: hypothetical protein DRR11_00205 [Gammaproteobacteria bacterium]|nr:MAG: hypothetical protein DRR11_00205 [Gammaproteobacteria bacterium]RLA36531.1 MAG: hypothetical protein DRR15_04705 [Gammaproteobacteria bacterium]